ncbi:histidine kinase-like ATPase [Mycena haematopus]|nr:histidine kinase-like ATPase [Mycena haematopus]
MTRSHHPLPIRRLQESLINRYSGGRSPRPARSALKELLENCLDAGATSIRVTVKDGGMKLLQIQDNGCGIRRADLPILAERFTTSKLSTFSDLSRITTYGFRGEALASISHVAHLSVMTKTKTETCAWKAHYLDGALVEPKPGQTAEPKPCAGNDGTTIIIEDLFYNTPTRLSALRSASEEYSRILDVITKYAVHNPKVSFTCKKTGSPSPELSTPSSSDVPQAIRLLYGHSIAKDLLHASFGSKKEAADDEDMEDDESEVQVDGESWTADVHFTNANYQSKKMIFLLFINHRLVESSRMKRALEAVYSGVLPKGASPFIYLSLQINPRDVDVNVHPTKKEVHFLNEDGITDQIADTLQQSLASQSHSRIFEYQTLLTGGLAEPEQSSSKKRKGKERERVEDEDAGAESKPSAPSAPKKTLSQYKVRTSLQDRTLESMFPVLNPTQIDGTAKGKSAAADTSKSREIKESECNLTSVKRLRQKAIKGKHKQLSEILEKHTFVGIVDLNQCLSLIQHSTKLYLVNHGALALVTSAGSNYNLHPPLRTLIEIAVELEETTEESGLTKPQIVDDYTPNLDKLPSLLMRLGPQVDWNSEMECFDSFLRELAYFYRWQIQHIVFPSLRRYLSAPKTLLDRDVVQIASLPDLYKVFERC